MPKDFFEQLCREQDLIAWEHVIPLEELLETLKEAVLYLGGNWGIDPASFGGVADGVEYILRDRALLKFLENKGPHWYKGQFYPTVFREGE